MFQSIVGIIAVMFSIYTLDKWEILPDEETTIKKPQKTISKAVVKTPQRFTDRIVQKRSKKL